MESNTVHIKNSEIKISLGAIFDFLLKHWKSIILISFIGAVLGLGIGFVPKNEKIEMKNVDEQKVSIFHDYNTLLNDKLLEKENDIILNFGENNIFVGKLDLYVNAYVEELGIIYDSFKKILVDEKFWNEIGSLFEEDYSTEQLKTLISVSSPNDEVLKEGTGKDNENKQQSAGHNLTRNECFTFQVIGNSEELCANMINVISKYLEKLENGIKYDFSSYSRKAEMRNIYKSNEVGKLRLVELLESTENLIGKVNSLKSNLNGEEVKYSKKLYPEDWKIDEDKENSILHYLKMPILIGFLAFFIICFIYTMKFIFDSHVKTASELNEMFGLHVFGVFKNSENKKGFDGYVQKREAKKDINDNSEDYIINSIKELNKSIVILTGSKNDEVVTNFMNDLSSKGNLPCYGQLQSDSQALAAAHNNSSVILVVYLWNSTIDEINREIEIAIAQNINVLGCVVVK